MIGSRRTAVVATGLLVGLLLSACGTQPEARTRASSPAVQVAASPAAAEPAGTAVPTAAVPVAVLPSAVVSPPAATPNPCAHNRAPQKVLVKLAVQHLWMCERSHVVYSAPVTSGIPGGYTSTPTGSYTVQALTRNTTLTLNTGQTYDVQYWIPFDAPLFGFHDSSWQDFPYGSAKYRTRGSHGCVHMPLKAIAFLYRWAHVGAKVRIRD